MRLRNFFVVRAFLVLLTVFLVLLSLGNLGIYRYSRQAVSEEVIRLNQVSLAQVADSTGQMLANLCDFGERIAINTQIQELLVQTEDRNETDQITRTVLMELLSEFNATHMDGSTLVEPHVVSSDGTSFSVYHTNIFSWDQICQDPRYAKLLSGEEERLILPTEKNDSGQGVMGHSFQIALTMRELLSGQVRGVVILDVSELALYRKYRNYLNEEVALEIITEDGHVVSHKNEKLIGTDSGWNVQEGIALKAKPDGERWVEEDHFLLYEWIPGSHWLLVEQMPEEMVFGTMTRVRNVMWGVTAVCAVVAIGAFYLMAGSVLQRVMRIKDKMGEVIDGDLTVRISVEREDEFGRIESAFNAMVEEIGQLIEKVRQSEHQKRTAEMDFLCAQISSHFIHNTLTSIRFMLEMDRVKEAGEMIFYFSKLLRQTLSRSNEFVSLREEIDTLQCYVMLQSYRYQGVFEASYDISEEILDAQVPALILQPVVENAIFHGSSERFTHIRICGYRDKEHLIITVEDDG
ncbi:MAG: histidine kinase, partial [Lachnospiraceae bacterium]|nr:histidine kinase [Lachnospiraceae bacterium]